MLLSITPHHNLRHFNPKPSSSSTAAHCRNPNPTITSNLRTVSIGNGKSDDVVTVSSAAAVAAAIRKASSSPVEFVERIEEEKMDKLPSCDFQTLCVEQLDLFRRIVHPDANLSV